MHNFFSAVTSRMPFESQSNGAREPVFFPQNRRARRLLPGFLLVLALGIRLYHLKEPPLDFHPTRQYFSAIIARGFYYETQDSLPEWKKKIAIINKEKQGFLEPPIMELMAALSYRLAGGEYLWLPRLFSSIFWIVGGGFVYLISKKLSSPDAAVFATAFYLFIPYGVSASRSFQPEPLMVMMLMVSLFTLLRYHERPLLGRLFLAATLSALALLVKPMNVFTIFGAAIALALEKQKSWKAFFSPSLLIFAGISLLPSLIYFTSGLFREGLQAQAQKRILPQLLLSLFFWKGWHSQIDWVVGDIAFFGALFGVLLFRPGRARALIIGLWVGYLAYGLSFSYHTATHNYYHLPLIPIVAIGFGLFLAWILNRLVQGSRHSCLRLSSCQWARPAASWGILLLAIALSLGTSRARLNRPDSGKIVRNAEEIGERVGHSAKTIFLTFAYGKPLQYYGDLSGEFWPSQGDLRYERVRGIPGINASELFQTRFLKDSPEFFIITDFQEFDRQSDLKNFLTRSYPLFAQTPDYLIFELRKKLNSDPRR